MTGILSGDIRFLASEVMDDVPEGGGAPTSTVIVDGASNAIFPDVSEVARAGGDVSVRKLFLSVDTDNTDVFMDAHVIVSEAPTDPNVSVVIFETQDFFETRADAQDRMEAYLYASSLWAGYLYESHIAGMRSIQIFQRPGSKLPVSGQTLYLVSGEGTAGEVAQYIRVIGVESETRTFTYQPSNGGAVDYDALIVTCELSARLESNFTGSAASNTFTPGSSAAKLRSTMVADATLYYGAMVLTEAVAIGDTSCDVESIFTRLVPSAQTETALIDKPLTGDVLPMVASATEALTRTVSIAAIAAGGRYVLPTGCWPGSLNLATPSGVVTDDGLGGVLLAGGAAGSINYNTGEITFTAAIGAGNVTEVYRPAAGVSLQAHSLSRAVTPESRAYTWVIPLTPLPAPGTLSLAYMAQGEWYELRDNGLGVLAGSDAGYGVGTVSYVTGTISATLGALPDVGSEIIVSWGTGQEFIPITTASLNIQQPKIEFYLGAAIEPGTLDFAWFADDVAQTASDNGSAAIAGDATGAVIYGAGTGWLRPALMPDASAIAVSFDGADSQSYGTTAAGGTTLSGTIPNAPLAPGSITASLLIAQSGAETDEGGHVATSSRNVPGVLRDNGAGGWVLDGLGALAGSSINYSTGAYVITINQADVMPVATYTNTTQVDS